MVVPVEQPPLPPYVSYGGKDLKKEKNIFHFSKLKLKNPIMPLALR